jgi:hypothetical protein
VIAESVADDLAGRACLEDGDRRLLIATIPATLPIHGVWSVIRGPRADGMSDGDDLEVLVEPVEVLGIASVEGSLVGGGGGRDQ